jgi:hypothetical protein
MTRHCALILFVVLLWVELACASASGSEGEHPCLRVHDTPLSLNAAASDEAQDWLFSLCGLQAGTSYELRSSVAGFVPVEMSVSLVARDPNNNKKSSSADALLPPSSRRRLLDLEKVAFRVGEDYTVVLDGGEVVPVQEVLARVAVVPLGVARSEIASSPFSLTLVLEPLLFGAVPRMVPGLVLFLVVLLAAVARGIYHLERPDQRSHKDI